MNAGAYGKEIREVVKEVTCIDENLQVYTLQNENMNFSYRHSRFKEKKEIIPIRDMILTVSAKWIS